MKNATLFL